MLQLQKLKKPLIIEVLLLNLRQAILPTIDKTYAWVCEGSNGDGERRRLLQERPPQNRQEQNQNRRQRYMRDKLNKQYGKGKFVIDHKYSLNRLGQQLWGLGEKLKVRRINRIEAVEGPVGNNLKTGALSLLLVMNNSGKQKELVNKINQNQKHQCVLHLL